MHLYLVVDVDNNHIAVVPAYSKDNARARVANLLEEPMAFLCAEKLKNNIFDLREVK